MSQLENIVAETVANVPTPTDGVLERAQADIEQQEQQTQAASEAAPAKRGRGRPKGSGKKPSFISAQPAASDAPPSEPDKVEPCADLAVMMIQGTGIALAGDAGKMGMQEALNMRGGFVAYFKMKGIDDVPPWVVLAGCVLPYYARILTVPTAQSKVSVMFGGVWRGVKNIFSRVRKKQDARFNSRDNGKRQDNSGADDRTNGEQG